MLGSGCCASDRSSCHLALAGFPRDSREAVAVAAEKDAAVVAVALGIAGSAFEDS